MSVFFSTQRGISHAMRGIANQDAVFAVRNKGVEVVAVADGVGTCKNSQIGSQFVARFMARYACEHFEKLATMSNKEIRSMILRNFMLSYCRSDISIESALSTLLLVARKGNQLLVLQIGDGKILSVFRGNSSQVFHDDGLPMNQSYTWHSSPECFCKELFNLHITPIDYMLLCTDGVYKPENAPVVFNNGLSYLDRCFTCELYRRHDDIGHQNFINTVVTASNGHQGDLDDKTAALMVLR